jgi:hypothetical protein
VFLHHQDAVAHTNARFRILRQTGDGIHYPSIWMVSTVEWPTHEQAGPGFEVRPMASGEIEIWGDLCRRVHRFPRSSEVGGAAKMFQLFVVRRDGRVTGHLTAATFWMANHGVAETEEDMRALIGPCRRTDLCVANY